MQMACVLRSQRLLAHLRCQLRCQIGARSSATASKSGFQTASKSSFQFKHVIYRFKFIRTFQTLSLFKLAQTGVTVVLVPAMYLLYRNDVVPLGQVLVVLGMSTFAVLVLFVFSYFARRVVGVISLDETRTLMRIGHLSFWGMRRNTYLNVEQVLRFTDSSESNRRDLFLKLYYYEHDSTHGAQQKKSDEKQIVLVAQANAREALDAAKVALSISNVTSRPSAHGSAKNEASNRGEISPLIGTASLASISGDQHRAALRRDYFLISIEYGAYPDGAAFKKVFGHPFSL